jgi:hypothetical protein
MIWSKIRRLLLPIYFLCCCLALPLYTWRSSAEADQSSAPRRLVLILDGVPFETIEELRREGYFRAFHQPARMVSTFPSLTNPSMIEILGAENSAGYEDQYYDRERNRLVGGFQDRIRGGKFIQGTFRELFNYHAPAFRGSLAYLAQPIGATIVAQADIAGFKRAFQLSPAPLFVGYIGATDSLAHLGGKGPLKSLLRTLDRTITQLRRETGDQLVVEILSDHGNNFAEHHHVKLNNALESAGFTVEKSLQHPRGVILPRYGLVGSGALFTRPELRRELAEVCAGTPGVDLAAFQIPGEEGRVITLVSRRGRARIFRDGERYNYEPSVNDPLELKSIMAGMRERGVLDANGFATREAWWEATRDHQYADPLRRLFDGFTTHVRTLADVLVSFDDGRLIGSPFFSIFAEMHATHGNLRRGESDGFAISTRHELGPAVRGSDIHRLFGLGEMKHAERYLSKDWHCQIVIAHFDEKSKD